MQQGESSYSTACQYSLEVLQEKMGTMCRCCPPEDLLAQPSLPPHAKDIQKTGNRQGVLSCKTFKACKSRLYELWFSPVVIAGSCIKKFAITWDFVGLVV